MKATLAPFKRHPLESLTEKIDYGHTASASDRPVGPRFLRITDIQNGSVEWASVPFCTATDNETDKYHLLPGDIVFARTGATTGKSFLIKDCPDDTVFASYLIRVRPSERVEPRYLAYFFDTPDYWAQIKKHAQGAGQPGVNASKLKQLQIPLPPLSEQKRIADILDKADAIRRKRQEALDITAELPVAAFFQMFDDPARNPKGWESRQLKHLIADGDKVNYGVVQPGGEYSGGVPIVRVGDMQNLRVSTDGLKRIDPDIERQYKRSRLVGDELLVACVGSIGLIALADERLTDCNIVRAIARIRCGKDVDRQYLAAYLATPAIQSYFIQSTRTVSQPTLNIKQIEETTVLVPPIDLQREYSAVIGTYLNSLQREEAARETTAELFSALAQSAFEGEL